MGRGVGGMILDAHNCGWLTRFPHEVLAGGSMYAFRLPPAIPAVGAPGGPPSPEAYRSLGGTPGGMDMVRSFSGAFWIRTN
jgi:hypothetical protein